ncbi:outer membrane protein OmpA-like peptidoglycan-associated protein [Rhodoferax ferrireducens]|uniref:Outer membrane protein OmpA-like peptidoglycan-associated protein n=1 Tax=Rhodoferax ferrireducens TaxID=192843 RepID=A0ABU2CGG7_9BURK|nr:OmpA family protein [Rhodoferax ferrireducens]MDR7380423.1 outer membrane protein OmpA-like peptidoglycan-associated protein [Rhodoferax ferrireducens]
MNIKRAISLAGFSLCLVGATVQLSGCSSVPKPAEADGSSRVPVNDATRVQALQQRVNADRQLLSDNNLLRAQVDVLQAKLNEMTTIVREALTLPPAPRPLPAPVPVQPSPAAVPQSMAAPDLPAYAYETNSSGVVIRVFHPFARTEFEPSEQIAQALRSSVRGAEKIEVRGHTDSNVVNAMDKLIAIERAEKARTWLINNGADSSKISTKYFTAGNFLVENLTPKGRSLNRRVEIDVRNQQLAGKHLALSN